MKESRKRVWLRVLREGRHMTQTQVAADAGISLTYYQYIEYGWRTPSEAVAARLAKVLGFPPEFLNTFNHREVIVAQSE